MGHSLEVNTSLTPPGEDGTRTRTRLRGAALAGAALLGASCVALAAGAVWQLAETLEEVMIWARPTREAGRGSTPLQSPAAASAAPSASAAARAAGPAPAALAPPPGSALPPQRAPAPSDPSTARRAPAAAKDSGAAIPVATAGKDPAEAFEKAVTLQAPRELELVPSNCDDVYVYIVSIAEAAPSESAASLGVGKTSPARLRRPGQSVGEFEVVSINDDWSGLNPGVWLQKGDEICRADLDGNAARVHVAPKIQKKKKRVRRRPVRRRGRR